MIFSTRYFFIVAFVLVSAPAGASGSILLKCHAFGGSHTIRMSFIFHPETCRLVWRELDQDLVVSLCKPPRIVAEKPFADGRESRVHFHLDSRWFMDQYGTIEEEGSCEITALRRESP